MQRERVVLRLRELILSGEFRPGQRVAEIPVSERLGVSRTPVRQAFHLLAGEGLLEPAGTRGFLVRNFTEKDVFDAIELRGILEGAAARLLAEAGVGAALEARLRACITEGEAIVRSDRYEIGNDAQWAAVNERFHKLIVEATANRALIGSYEANDKLPFAAAKATLGAETSDADLRRKHHDVVRRAHLDHVTILGALLDRQGARAEALLREHALLARENIVLFGMPG